ncbi:DUF262 domain-containing protein [uncultured Sneathiella sp.]|jgi:hypothetical protein|uniref:DUF262 domain-containing protein n=1 Tax=uncultured Sneathiella sp. TaxID=879315 RepID=UPI0030DA1728|tara:strand:- start:798 stop:1787 length:990 start_codon:yes stop_codon:yes gene_type:complete
MDRVDYQSFIIQDLINDYNDQKLDLNPWYQRRSVWTQPQKAYLINTLFERKPIPAVYIRHTIDLEKEKSIKEVVDGQQRIRSILEFRNDKFSSRTEPTGVRKIFSRLNGKEREKFLLTPLPVGYLLGATDEDVIDIFARINSVSKSLNAQEKRNAEFSGEFKQFCLHFSTSKLSFWRNADIFTANDIARMNEVQFVSDVIYNLINGLSDFRPSSLKDIYKENDNEFAESGEISARLEKVFDIFMKMNSNVFSDTIFSRPPILFSLILCLDRRDDIDSVALEDNLHQIDAEFNDETLQTPEIVAFRNAVSASTQRLLSRRARQDFLISRI